MKFTEKGKVEVLVKIIEEENEDKFLSISVIDTGVGISHDNQDKLFKLFGFIKDTG